MLAELVELAPAGFEQVDGDGFVEFALYGAPGELPALATGPADIGGIRVEVSGTEVGDDWAERWREFHRPVQVGRLYMRPPWTEPLADSIDIVIDPGQAFGTGAHPTTRLCLELLQEVGAAENGRYATKAAAPPTSAAAPACSPSPPRSSGSRLSVPSTTKTAALEATTENARVNGVTLERVERYDLRTEPAPVAPVMTSRTSCARCSCAWRSCCPSSPRR